MCCPPSLIPALRGKINNPEKRALASHAMLRARGRLRSLTCASHGHRHDQQVHQASNRHIAATGATTQ
eukprot:10337018-Alexandrium_andersonii.AAC.1